MKKILVVEEDEFLGLSMKEIIKSYGFEADWIQDPAEAYEKLKTHEKYDIVLCDTKMPGMKGYELKKRLDDEGIEYRFIGMSADSKYEEKWKEIGCEFIEKGGISFFSDIKLIMEELKK